VTLDKVDQKRAQNVDLRVADLDFSSG